MEAGAQPLTIEPTAEERRLGRLLDPNIRAAMVGLEEEGVVVIKQVVDRRHCAALLERILSGLFTSATQLIQSKGCTGSAAQKCALILCCKPGLS